MNPFRKLTFVILALIAGLFVLIGALSIREPKQTTVSVSPPTATPVENPTTLIEQDLIVPVPGWRTGIFAEPMRLLMPDKVQVSLFATGFDKPRMMAVSPDGTLYVTDPEAGSVYALPDADKNGIADSQLLVAENLGYPTGIAWHNQDLFVADTTRVYRLSNYDSNLAMEEKEVIIDNLPRGGTHVTRSLLFDDEYLYVSVGSSCNACDDDDRRGAVLRYSVFGMNEETYATGMRNAVGMTLHPDTGEIITTENGRDLLGDDLPPDEINTLAKGDFGWPRCYGKNVPDPKLGSEELCQATIGSTVDLPAHSAPLGLTFLSANPVWPEYLQGSLLVAFHGSWNRSIPTGYKVIRIDWSKSNATPSTTDFISGWLSGTKVLGRPVDVIVGSDDALYITDDKNGVIYRAFYKSN